MGVALSLNETDWERFFPSGTWLTDTKLLLWAAVICLSILTLSVKSEEPMKGLIGDVGEVLNDTTEGGDVREAGASTVIVRSCEVRFDAWRVKTWQIEQFKRKPSSWQEKYMYSHIMFKPVLEAEHLLQKIQGFVLSFQMQQRS